MDMIETIVLIMFGVFPIILTIAGCICAVIYNGEKERLRKREPIATKALDIVQKIRLEREDYHQLYQIKQEIDNLSKELNYLPLTQKEKTQQKLIALREKYMATKMRANKVDKLQQTLIDYAGKYLVGKPKIKKKIGYWWGIKEWTE